MLKMSRDITNDIFEEIFRDITNNIFRDITKDISNGITEDSCRVSSTANQLQEVLGLSSTTNQAL